jgi:uncharacterized membrane protein YdbT with pleckstrin-like domain
VDPEPGEHVFFHGHPSWRSMLGFYLRGLLGAILAGVIAGVATRAAEGSVELVWVIAAVLVVFVLMLLTGAVRRMRTTYTITNRRLTIDLGLVSREMHETRLERVQNVRSRQTVLQRMLGVGTVDFDTAAGAAFDFAFHGVENPAGIVRTVDRALHELGIAQPHV